MASWTRLRAAMETLVWHAGHATRAVEQSSSSAPVDTNYALTPSRGSNRRATWNPDCPPSTCYQECFAFAPWVSTLPQCGIPGKAVLRYLEFLI